MVKIKYIFLYLLFSFILVTFYYIYSNISLKDIASDKDHNRFFEYLELKTLDLRFKIRGVNNNKKDIVIIGIDEKSLNKIGKWPWKRDIHAKLIDELTKVGVKSIGFDISFTEPAISKEMKEYNSELKKTVLKYYKENKISKDVALDIAQKIVSYRLDEDEVLGESIKNAGNISIGTYNILDKNEAFLEQEVFENYTYRKSHYKIVDGIVPAMKFMLFSGESVFNPFRVYKIIPPIEIIGENCFGVASYEIGKPEIDGNVRKVPIVIFEEFTNAYFAPMYFMVYLNAFGYSLEKNVVLDIYNSKIDIYKDAENKKGKILTINTDKNGYQLLNFYGPKHTFKYISYIDILEKKYNADDLKNKIILVGYTDSAKGLYDMRATPFDPNIAGIEIHATALQNIIDNNFIKRFEVWQNMGLMFLILLVMISFFSIKKINFFFRNFLAVSLIISYTILTQILLNFGIWIELFYPVFSLFILYLLATITNYYGEEVEKNKIKFVFKHYTSPELIDELLKSPEKLKLGGERKELTVFFSDVAGFTSISENMEPEKLVELLNEYLTVMTNIILKNKGMVDKYIGDAIMAIFGAPLYYDNHAEYACLSALECREELKKLRENWEKKGLPKIFARIGINTGEMIIGNMGSNKRFNYTVMGDSVNLASRLEGANKMYHTEIMVSSDTYEKVKDKFEFRKLDIIRVKGKNKPVEIYELMDIKEKVDNKIKEKLNIYNQAIDLYQARSFRMAKEKFLEVLEKDSNDFVSKLYIERCNNYILNPPDENWDGVYTFTSK